MSPLADDPRKIVAKLAAKLDRGVMLALRDELANYCRDLEGGHASPHSRPRATSTSRRMSPSFLSGPRRSPHRIRQPPVERPHVAACFQGDPVPARFHAELAVNLAGTMAMFLIAIWEEARPMKGGSTS